MKKQKSVFNHHRETVRDKVIRVTLSILCYVPFLGFIYGVSWYIKKNLYEYLAMYFNLAAAQSMAMMEAKRVLLLRDFLSFPVGLPKYLSAQAESLAASTKATTLQLVVGTSTSLVSGILTVVVFVATIYAIFRIVKHYKTRTSENRMACLVANKIMPALEELNNTVLELKAEIEQLKSDK